MSIKTAALALALALLWPVPAPAAEALPTRGLTMAQVKARFGQPQQVDPAVGQPPITRWLYDGYTVYFERNICLHTVINHPRPTAPPTATIGDAAPMTTAQHEDNNQNPARQPDPRRNHTAAPAAPGDTEQPASPPLPSQHRQAPTGQAHPGTADDERAVPSDTAPASSATRAQRQQRQASSHFRFNAASGRVEIVNDAKGDQQNGTPSSAATDGQSTQPATNVTDRSGGTDTVAQPQSAPASGGGSHMK